jgi:hypothetical protein
LKLPYAKIPPLKTPLCGSQRIERADLNAPVWRFGIGEPFKAVDSLCCFSFFIEMKVTKISKG